MRAGEYAAKFAKEHGAGRVNTSELEAMARTALVPFERGAGGEGPYHVQHELQAMMQDLVGIVRREEEMQRALDALKGFRERAGKVGVGGNREYNPGWHTALDLHNLLAISEAIARAAIERKESRGGHFRDDYPEKSREFGSFNIVLRKGANGEMTLTREPIPALRSDLQQIIEDQK